MDSHSLTGGTMETTRSLLAVVIEDSLSSTMMTGKNLFFKESYNMRENVSLYFYWEIYFKTCYYSVYCEYSYSHCYQKPIILTCALGSWMRPWTPACQEAPIVMWSLVRRKVADVLGNRWRLEEMDVLPSESVTWKKTHLLPFTQTQNFKWCCLNK